jgi:hypothetical protein
LTGAEGVESKLARELLAEDAAGAAAQARRSERVLVAQFETEVQNVQDPRLVAQSLADTAARLVGAPALFFSYHESLKACLLQAHAGLAPGTPTDALSFRLSEAMLARIARYRKEGRTASLADDAQLMLLLARRLGSPRFEAWPVTGPGGRLLGALVVLGAASLQSESGGLGHVMKVSGHLYEQLKREAALAPEGGGRA